MFLTKSQWKREILVADYKWHPIEALTDKDRAIDLADIRPLYESWHASQERLKQSSPTRLRNFKDQLIRRLSVETGILERLYDLDRGTTEALVMHGFVEELVSSSNTNLEPSRLIDILRDQEAAIQLMIDCVARSRPLTKSVIHELHAILTRHQETTTAIDQFGNRFEIPLQKGIYKQQPNNPRRPEGTLHEYCPPIHVDAEMDNLLGWLDSYAGDDPVIVTAWLHHRFTQIHPYQDGNGRVARALTTLILLRANLLPLVVDRDLRVDYIKALEAADMGELSSLASLFARLERTAILQALSVDADAEMSHQKTLTAAVIEALTQKFSKRRIAKEAELRKVNGVALTLRSEAHRVIQNTFNELSASVSEIGDPETAVTDGGPDRGNAHYYRFQVLKSAREAGKYANLSEDHYFVKGSMRVQRERLVFVTSFHHVGRELSGIMEVTAFSQLQSFEDSDDRESVSQDFFLCSLEPFVFTYKTSPQDIRESFGRWLDSALAVAVKEYGVRL